MDAQVSGTRIAYDDAGSGPLVVRLHGLTTATLLHAVTVAPDRFDRLVRTCPPTAWASRPAQADVSRAGATRTPDELRTWGERAARALGDR